MVEEGKDNTHNIRWKRGRTALQLTTNDISFCGKQGQNHSSELSILE